MTDKPRAPQAFRIDSATETKTERAPKPRVKIEFHEAEEPQLPAEAPMAEANNPVRLGCMVALAWIRSFAADRKSVATTRLLRRNDSVGVPTRPPSGSAACKVLRSAVALEICSFMSERRLASSRSPFWMSDEIAESRVIKSVEAWPAVT